MISKSVTYNDLDGKPVTEEFWFHLTTAEALEIQFSQKNGLEAHIQRIVATKDVKEVFKLFREIIQASVGVRSEDGKRFVKDPDTFAYLVETGAYSELFLDVLAKQNMAEFIKGIVPADLEASLKKLPTEVQEQAVEKATDEAPEQPAWIKEDREPTMEEFRAATPEQQAIAFARKAGNKAG